MMVVLLFGSRLIEYNPDPSQDGDETISEHSRFLYARFAYSTRAARKAQVDHVHGARTALLTSSAGHFVGLSALSASVFSTLRTFTSKVRFFPAKG